MANSDLVEEVAPHQDTDGLESWAVGRAEASLRSRLVPPSSPSCGALPRCQLSKGPELGRILRTTLMLLVGLRVGGGGERLGLQLPWLFLAREAMSTFLKDGAVPNPSRPFSDLG